jgi:hypothetical protein
MSRRTGFFSEFSREGSTVWADLINLTFLHNSIIFEKMFVQQLGTKSMQENCHKTVKCTEHRVSKYKKYGKTYLCSDF